MTQYLVVYEQDAEGWSAFLPDVPGCVAAGETREETRQVIREALTEHTRAMLADGDVLPTPSAVWAEVIDSPVVQVEQHQVTTG